jgi:hypothetical protein
VLVHADVSQNYMFTQLSEPFSPLDLIRPREVKTSFKLSNENSQQAMP